MTKWTLLFGICGYAILWMLTYDPLISLPESDNIYMRSQDNATGYWGERETKTSYIKARKVNWELHHMCDAGHKWWTPMEGYTACKVCGQRKPPYVSQVGHHSKASTIDEWQRGFITNESTPERWFINWVNGLQFPFKWKP